MSLHDPGERVADPDHRHASAPRARAKRMPWIVGSILGVVVAIFAVIGIVAGVLHLVRATHARQLNERREEALALAVSPGLHDPRGVAVDAAGTVYVADSSTNRVLRLAAGSSTSALLPFTGLKLSTGVVNDSIAGVAVDAAGNVYVVDSGNNRVLKLVAASGTQTVLPFTGLDRPSGVAVDTGGDVYVADPGNVRVVKLAAGSTAQIVLPSTGGATPDAVAADAGTVYTSVFTRCGRATCSYPLRLAAGSNNWTRLPSAGVQEYVAVDTAGNLYVVTAGDAGGVMRLAPGSSSWTALPGVNGFRAPGGLAVDARGNVYVTDNRTPGEGAKGRGLLAKLPTG